MIAPHYFFALLFLVAATLIVIGGLGLRYTSFYTRWPFPLFLVGLFVALIATFGPAIMYGTRAVNRYDCARYGENTKLTTRYVLSSRYDTGSCLVRTPDGKYIPRDNLRVVVR